MVEIDSDSYLTQERGICKKVKEQKGGEVFDLLDKTEMNGMEYAVAFVEDSDGVLHSTKVVSGDEESISHKSISQLRLDAPMVVDGYNTNENPVHLLHTHPGGFPEHSLNDIVSQIEELDKGIKFQSSLIATMFGGVGGDNALVNGMELVETPDETERGRIDTVLDSVLGMVEDGRLPSKDAKDRVWDEIDSFYQSCSVKLERGEG